MLKIERFKQKHKHLSVLLLLLLAFQLLFPYRWAMTVHHVSSAQNGLLLNYTMTNAIFLPLVITMVVVKYIDIEHQSDTWKLLFTIFPMKKIFLMKLITILQKVGIYLLFEFISVVLIGYHFDFLDNQFVFGYVRFILTTCLIVFLLVLISTLLSFYFKNQIITIATGVLGSIYALFCLFLPRSIFHYLPWGMIANTGFITIHFDESTRISNFEFVHVPFHVYFILGLWILLLWILKQKLDYYFDIDGLSLPHIFPRLKRHKTNGFHHLPTGILKLKHANIWWVIVIVPLITGIFGTGNYLANTAILKSEWYSLWSQHTLFMSLFFFPTLLAMLCGYVYRIEHAGKNWYQISVCRKPYQIVMEKVLLSWFLSGICLIWMMCIYMISGMFVHLSTPIPFQVIEWFLTGYLGMMAICSFYCFIGLVFKNFASQIGMGVISGLIGLVCISKGYLYQTVFSLSAVGLRTNNPYMQIDLLSFCMSSLLYICLFIFLSIVWLKITDR